MDFRIGVHLGDVIEKADGTVYGDGVNIAARLQSLAEPRGTVVSDSIRTAVKGKVEADFQDHGEQWVKSFVDPVHTFKLVARESEMATGAQGGTMAPHNVSGDVSPQPHARGISLYGRDDDLKSLRALLHTNRLVSIVGGSGIGKTALARALAQDKDLRSVTGTAHFAELAPLPQGSLIAPTVAEALGISLGQDASVLALAKALSTSRMLLVLDNCEHLLSGVAELVSALRATAPNVSMLMTSQEPIRLAEEYAYRLNALSLPDGSGVESAREAGAVSLFEARVQETDRRFSITESNVAAVVEVCRQLDGIALAIELAAARVPLLGLEGLRKRLNDRFQILRGGSRLAPQRHQTLRAAMEWSYGLLSDDERLVFCRLGIFVGSFELEGVQRVAKTNVIDEWGVIDYLGALVEKSMVLVDIGEPQPRYRLSGTVRAFALEKLSEAGGMQETQTAHALAVLATFEMAYQEQWVTTLKSRLDRYLSNLDDLRSALIWAASLEGDDDLLVALAGAAKWIWSPSQRRLEGLAHLRRAMATVHVGTPSALDARLHLGYAELAHPQVGSVEIGAIERAVAKYRDAGERVGLYLSLSLAAKRAALQRNHVAARGLLSEAEDLVDLRWPLKLRLVLLQTRASTAEIPEAVALWEEHARLSESIGERADGMRSLMNAAVCCLSLDLEKSIRLLRYLVEVDGQEGKLGQLSAFARANLSDALSRRGLADEALTVLREATPGLLASGLFGTFLDTYALLILRKGRHDLAAIALGRADSAFSELESQRSPDSWARDNVFEELHQLVSPRELDRLIRQGRASTDEELAQLLATASGVADLPSSDR